MPFLISRPTLVRKRSTLLLIFGFVFSALAGTAAAQDSTTDAAKDTYKLAQKQVKQGNLTEAEKLFRRALEIEPSFAPAKVELANVLIKQRDVAGAYELSFAAAKENPSNARAFAVLGTTLLTAGRFSDAYPILMNAIALDRKEDLAWAALGLLNFYENRVQQGVVDLRQAVNYNSDEPDYQFALGQVAARAELYKESAAAYRNFLMIAPDLDRDRRARIKGLINFLEFLGQRDKLYVTGGSDQTTVPFKLVGNRPVIQLYVNDRERPLNFVLDTGSGISVISDKTANEFKIKPVARGGFAKGLGGDGRFEIVYGFIRTVSVGEVKVKNVPVYIRKFHSDVEDIDGYIGLSLIAKFLTTIDYGSHEFVLTKREPAAAAELNSQLSLPLRLTSSGFLSGEVQLQGVESPLNFIVDTGASVSVISDDLARMEPFNRYVRGDRMRVIGSAGITDDVPSLELPRVTFGSHTCESITAIALDLGLINEASGFQQSGILGGNFLRNYRLTFDFRNSRVTFTPLAVEK
jgi:tetratricopeptide (TPR) repeat protein